MSLQRLSPLRFHERLAQSGCVVLDVRRAGALRRNPIGIPGAIPILLDEPDARIPDLPRDTGMLAYCLCSGQASSTRVALWLLQAGYREVAVLEGGLPAWQAAGLPMAVVELADRQRLKQWISASSLRACEAHAESGALIAQSAFLAGHTLPVRRPMTVLFIDMVNSTELLFGRSPEDVLRIVQAFMEVVVGVTVQHCGDVHDFEGDGAMLYFAGPGEAVPAAFALCRGLAKLRASMPALPMARIALDSGPLVIGHVGTRDRRGLSFIGASVNTAARILKLAPPNGIIATDVVVEHARHSDPDLAASFARLPDPQTLKGFSRPVALYVAEPSLGAPG